MPGFDDSKHLGKKIYVSSTVGVMRSKFKDFVTFRKTLSFKKTLYTDTFRFCFKLVKGT